MNWDVGFVTSTMQEIGVQLPRLLEVYDQLFKTRVQATEILFPCLTVVHVHGEKLPLQRVPVEDQLVFLPVGSLLAASEETAAPGGVHPCAAVRIRGRSQQSSHL